jgi:hypothetical protein
MYIGANQPNEGNKMAMKKLLAVLSTIACASAMAQGALGTVSNVQGVATATTGTSGAAVAPGTAVTNGMRIVTTSSGSVTVRMNSGCTVTVPPSSGVTVLQSMNCQQLQAAVQPVGLAIGASAFSPNPAFFNGIILAGGILVVGGIIREGTRDDNVSPN